MMSNNLDHSPGGADNDPDQYKDEHGLQQEQTLGMGMQDDGGLNQNLQGQSEQSQIENQADLQEALALAADMNQGMDQDDIDDEN